MKLFNRIVLRAFVMMSIVSMTACGPSDQSSDVNGSLFSNNKWAEYSKEQLLYQHKIGVEDIAMMRKRASDLSYFQDKAKRKTASGFDVTANGLKKKHDDDLSAYVAKIASIEEALKDLHGVDVSSSVLRTIKK